MKDLQPEPGLRGKTLVWLQGAIGLIGFAAMNGIARQPEATGKIQTNMLIAASLIEGVALFGAVICLILGLK
jgi:F-type H+-transporting ATPase subunit c